MGELSKSSKEIKEIKEQVAVLNIQIEKNPFAVKEEVERLLE